MHELLHHFILELELFLIKILRINSRLHCSVQALNQQIVKDKDVNVLIKQISEQVDVPVEHLYTSALNGLNVEKSLGKLPDYVSKGSKMIHNLTTQ